MPKDRDIDALMTASETDIGVSSIVRCSFFKMAGGNCKTSEDVFHAAFRDKYLNKTLSNINVS